MKLILMRHGEALHAAVDPEMRLSPRGRREAAKMGEYLKREGVLIDEVWHSSKARAVETAQCVADVLGLDAAALNLHRELAPEGDIERAKEKINDAKQTEHFQGLLIVSHMPFLPQLVASLTGQMGQADFETASAICLMASGGVWKREWFEKPENL